VDPIQKMMKTVTLQKHHIRLEHVEEPTVVVAVEDEGLKVGVEVRIATVTTP